MIPRVSLRLGSAVSRVTSDLQLYVSPKHVKLQLPDVTAGELLVGSRALCPSPAAMIVTADHLQPHFSKVSAPISE